MHRPATGHKEGKETVQTEGEVDVTRLKKRRGQSSKFGGDTALRRRHKKGEPASKS